MAAWFRSQEAARLIPYNPQGEEYQDKRWKYDSGRSRGEAALALFLTGHDFNED